MHQLLLVDPTHVVGFLRSLGPLSGAVLDMEGIGEDANHEAEREYSNRIQNSQNDARLEVPDLAGQTLPSIPKIFQVLSESRTHQGCRA